MTLENTDKAFAGILDAVKQFSQQVQPDVFNSFSNVAMLSVQGDIISAHVWLIVGIIAAIFGLICFALCWNSDNFSSGTGAFFSAVLFLIGMLISGESLTTMYSPLTIAAAHDGHVALAYEALRKVKSP